MTTIAAPPRLPRIVTADQPGTQTGHSLAHILFTTCAVDIILPPVSPAQDAGAGLKGLQSTFSTHALTAVPHACVKKGHRPGAGRVEVWVVALCAHSSTTGIILSLRPIPVAFSLNLSAYVGVSICRVFPQLQLPPP